jgi:small subunit ribosomal protein S2
MADVTAEARASAPSGGAPGASAHPIHTDVTIRDLLDAGVHFGHQTQRWNPRMKTFLFGERNGVHIVDLDQTLPRMRAALDFARESVASGGKVLFVGTKRQAAAPVQLEASRSGQFYVNNRWLGGMLTNFKTVKKSIERFKELLALAADEEKAGQLSKKELAKVHRQIDKYRKSLDGIRDMERLPEAVFVIDVNREAIAISEAQRLGIPIVAVVDSNCDPLGIDFVIPGNDDSIRAIQLYCSRMADACQEGAVLFNERLQAQTAAREREAEKAAGAGPTTGRVVVDIKHPPRRRGAASFGGRRDESDLADRPGAGAEAPVASGPPAAAAKPEEEVSGS